MEEITESLDEITKQIKQLREKHVKDEILFNQQLMALVSTRDKIEEINKLNYNLKNLELRWVNNLDTEANYIYQKKEINNKLSVLYRELKNQ
jgi:hypothetical protein